MGAIRILVVDDSFFMRKVIGDILRADPDMEIVGEAADGIDALKKIESLHPTVVTLDIEMPQMGGLETLRTIVSKPSHPPVVMISGYAADGVDITLECLRLGAADFVAKPSGSFSIDMDKIADLLREKVKAAATVDIPQPVPPQPSTPKMLRYSKTGGVVVVGASTGGPAALEAILPQLPANFPYPVVIVQHLPKEFTGSFVARLQKTCQLQVARADNNTRLSAGTMYIVPGGTTTTVSERQGTPFFAVVTNVADIQTPSIDAVMVSIADVYGVKTVGVILTGMGSDGAAGMARIKQTGGTTIAQDRATSIVYGMNKEIVERGLADSVVPLDAVVDTLNELLQ